MVASFIYCMSTFTWLMCSILDIRELSVPVTIGIGSSGCDTVRLIRIRNPHGVGEWTGDWSDQSSQWSDLLFAGAEGAQLSRTGVDDGTFWIDFTHFMMAFCLVDVSFAYTDWHCRSFPNTMPVAKDQWRLCQKLYLLRPYGDIANAAAGTSVFVSALQPTKRGVWCRQDRKKSYKLGDLSILIGKVSTEFIVGATASEVYANMTVVGGGLCGATSSSTTSAFLDDVNAVYVICVLCLGSASSAAETSKAQPFKVRLHSSNSLSVTAVDVYEGSRKGLLELDPSYPSVVADPRGQHTFKGINVKAVILAMVHKGLGIGATMGGVCVGGGRLSDDIVSLCNMKHEIRQLNQNVYVTITRGRGVVTFMLCDSSVSCRDATGLMTTMSLVAYCKSAVGRGVDGALTNNKEKADVYNAQHVPSANQKKTKGFYPSKWSAFTVTANILSGHQRLCMILSASGVQFEVGEIELSLSVSANVCTKACHDTTMDKWLGNVNKVEAGEEGIFSPLLMERDLLNHISEYNSSRRTSSTVLVTNTITHCGDEEFDLETAMALSSSYSHNVDVEDSNISAALAASLDSVSSSSSAAIDHRNNQVVSLVEHEAAASNKRTAVVFPMAGGALSGGVIVIDDEEDDAVTEDGGTVEFISVTKAAAASHIITVVDEPSSDTTSGTRPDADTCAMHDPALQPLSDQLSGQSSGQSSDTAGGPVGGKRPLNVEELRMARLRHFE